MVALVWKQSFCVTQMRRFHVALNNDKMNKAEQVIKIVQDQSVLPSISNKSK